MRAVHRLAPLAVPTAHALSSRGIPATGVMEAGGPASGIPPASAVYFVRNGTLVAVPRRVPEVGDVETAVEALLQGPTPEERRERLTTRLTPQSPLPATMAPANPQDGSAAPTATQLPAEVASEVVEVTTRGESVSVELPAGAGRLTSLAANQVICTAAWARLLALGDAESVTVTVSVAGGEGQHVEGSGERCPDL
jgi:hypothetical protein